MIFIVYMRSFAEEEKRKRFSSLPPIAVN